MPISADRNVFVLDQNAIVPSTNNRRLIDIDLAFNGHSTQHSTHSLHPYVAAINPPLVRTLIETYIPANSRILDPYCGGGGVLVESMILNRDCAGYDINPLAVMVARAKTTWLEKNKIQDEYIRVRNRFKQLQGNVQPYVSEAALFWFFPETSLELAALGCAINEIEDEKIKNLFQVILSYTARSVMLTYRGEVRLRKLTGKDIEKFTPNVMNVFDKKSKDAIVEVPYIPKGIRAEVQLTSILNMPAGGEEFNSIICSPPYADDKNGVGYFQFSRYLLEWTGMTPETINSYKRQFLGGEKEGKTLPPSSTLRVSAEKMNSKKPGKFSELAAFYADYYQSLAEMKRVVTDWIIIVTGNRVLGRTVFDNAYITIEMFETLGGVELEDYYSRVITKKRIPNLGSDGGGINKEHILIFRKKK